MTLKKGELIEIFRKYPVGNDIRYMLIVVDPRGPLVAEVEAHYDDRWHDAKNPIMEKNILFELDTQWWDILSHGVFEDPTYRIGSVK